MKQELAEKHKNKKGKLYRNLIELVLVGSVTGICAGAVVTTFNILMHEGETIARDVYAYVRANPAFIPLLLLALVAGAFLIGVAVNVSSVIRGCGIPQTEGATRGIVPLKWWRDLTLMAACCLLSVFMGLSIGTEGPSVLIGACTGDGVAAISGRNPMIRKYQITGGACAGLAVAGGAPLTGMAFAFEEAYKRLTPEVLICSMSSVVFAMLARMGVYDLFQRYTTLEVDLGNAFSSYVFYDLPIGNYFFALLAGIVCGILGVAFYKSAFAMRKAFRKIEVKNNRKLTYGLRILVAVLLGGLVSFLAEGAIGGGHGLIEFIGNMGEEGMQELESTLPMSLFWILVIVLLLRFFITTVNVGSGIPCGIFIPMIAIGACLGTVLNRLWIIMGMDSRYNDLMVMICMAAFFASVVKAPITSIVMICEFTGSFAHLLPAIIAVFVGYFIGEMFRTDGIYEELLEQYEHETGIHEREICEVFTVPVAVGSMADKREVRDVLWPSGVRVREIFRGEDTILPEGDTVLYGGDVLTIVCKTTEPKKIKEELQNILG